jgi:hypothetical protein
VITREWILEHMLTRKGGLNNRTCIDTWWTNNNFQVFKQSLLTETSWLPTNATITERAYAIVAGISNRPVCRVCGTEVPFKNYTTGYRTACSLACSTRIPERNAKIAVNTDHVARVITMKANNLEKYGDEAVSRVAEIRQLQLQGKIDKYGSLQNARNEQKRRDTLFERYGVEDLLATDLHQKKMQTARALSVATNGIKGTSGTSLQEMDLMNFISENSPFPFVKDYSIVGNSLELDGYCKELNLAIEYCGLYWHSDRYKLPFYHYNKYDKCRQRGVRLITIFEDEWLYRRSQVQDFILAALGKFDNRVYARKCVFKPLDKVACYQFLNSYHLQGQPSSCHNSFGLFYNEHLVGVVSFGKHHRYGTKTVLNRLAFKHGWQIIGGASKLVKNSLKILDTNEVITWSDNRWSQGTIYKALGFVLDNESKFDYSYVDNQTRISKQSMQKSAIGCPPDITEKEFCRSLGYYRIWDCGKKRWKYTK